MNHNKMPSNPSEAFSEQSYDSYSSNAAGKSYTEQSQEREQVRENLLDSESAAFAAKPWMDVAVNLHDAKNAANADMIDEGETVYSAGMQGSLDSLTGYAEKRARMASDGTRGDDLTQHEDDMLDVFKAETEMENTQASFSLDSLSSKQVDQAYDMAKQRAKDASQQGNAAEARKWNDLARRTDKYNELIFGNSLDAEERSQYERELRPDAENAGSVLAMMNENGTLDSDEAVQRLQRAKLDAKNMRMTAQMYELFAEAQAVPTLETSTEAPRQILDVADSSIEAQEMLYSQSELLEGLYDESSAYNDYFIKHRDEFTSATNQLDGELRRFNKFNDGFKAALESWKADSLGFDSFNKYVAAITAGDVEAGENIEDAAHDASNLMRTRAWNDRLSAAKRRMSRKNADKSEVLSVGAQFAREYFKV